MLKSLICKYQWQTKIRQIQWTVREFQYFQIEVHGQAHLSVRRKSSSIGITLHLREELGIGYRI